jgi:hypothetical protein
MKKKHSKTTMLAISCKQNADIHRKKNLPNSQGRSRKISSDERPINRKGVLAMVQSGRGGFYILKKYQLSKEHVFHDIWTEICGAEPSKILGAEPC